MNRGLSRTQKQYVVAGIISILLIVVAAGIAYFATVRQIEGKYKARLTAAEEELTQNKKMVYMAKDEIASGSQITKDNTIYQEALSNIPTDYYINEEDIGKLAVVDIGRETPILKNMVASDNMSNDLREEEFEVVHLNTNLLENDYVDVRIMFPNGENYVVLSKKSLKNLSLEESKCFLWLNEEEIVTVSSAIVDAYLHNGAKLYTAKYIEPAIQEASEVTYTPNEDVISLMKRDLNIVEIASKVLREELRAELELRLNAYKKKYGDMAIGEEASNVEPTETSLNGETVYGNREKEGDTEYVNREQENGQ